MIAVRTSARIMAEIETIMLIASSNLTFKLYFSPSNKSVPKQQSAKADAIPRTLFRLVPMTELPSKP